MDPTEALAQIRKIMARVIRQDGANPDDSVRLAELIEGLDGWIDHGGYLPDQWRPCEECGPNEGNQAGRCNRHGKLLLKTRPRGTPA